MKQIASKQGVLIADRLDTSLARFLVDSYLPVLPARYFLSSSCSHRGPSVPAEYHRDRPRGADVASVESHG
jgi:hypothetical protein